MKKAIAFTTTLSALALPLVTLAAIENISDVGEFIIETINGVLVPVLFAVAFIVFLWGAFTTFIMGAGSEDKKDSGKKLMLYSLIGFFVMVSIWGLINILVSTVDFGDNTGPSGGTPNAGVQIGG